MSDIMGAVRNYVLDGVIAGGTAESLTSETRLIEEELIDSLAIFEMVAFMEDRFGIAIEPEDINIENFETLASIVRLIETKLTAQRASQ